MTHAWISLREGWKLEDVQAVLNIIVSLLSAVSIFILTRLFWQTPATKIAHGSNVSLPSLLTLSSLGEAFDIVAMLRSRLIQPKYVNIHLQLLLLAIFSTSAIFSGPVARYSSRLAEKVSTLNVTGLLANGRHNNIGFATGVLNLTQTSLDQAGFPLDQLPDFIPDVSIPWQYRPEEWNNTWSMSCDYTNSTPVTLNVTNDGCDDWWHEIPDLAKVLNPDDWASLFGAWGGYYADVRYEDVLMFLFGTYYDDKDKDTDITWKMTVSIAALHLHNLSKLDDNYTGDCQFAAGPVEFSSYTKASCHLTRRKDIPFHIYAAFPDSGDLYSVPASYLEYYMPRFGTESVNHKKISIIMPSELVRFYQTYVIVKDTQNEQPVSRLMSVAVEVVHLSTVFLAICVLVAFLVVVSFIIYTRVLLIYRNGRARPPLSKLDWMIQSIEGKIQWHSPGEGPLRRSATSMLKQDQLTLRVSDTQRAEFEQAVYGDHQQSLITPKLDSFECQNLLQSSLAHGPQIVYSGPQPMFDLNHLPNKLPRQSVAICNGGADQINPSPLRPEFPMTTWPRFLN